MFDSSTMFVRVRYSVFIAAATCSSIFSAKAKRWHSFLPIRPEASGPGRRTIVSSATAGGSSPLCAILLLTWVGIGAGVIEAFGEFNGGFADVGHVQRRSLLLCTRNSIIVFFDSDGRGASSADATQGLGATGGGSGRVDLAHAC